MSAAAALFLGLALSSAHAEWATVGAACSPDGILANSNGFLVCSGGVWVANSMRAGNTVATCNSGNAGYIRWSGSAFEGCDGDSWITLASTGGLKVYQDDGTTVVGNLVGTNGAATQTCIGIVYADTTTGQLSALNTSDCASSFSGSYSIYWSGSNCTGTSYTSNTNYYGYCCTGSAVCLTDICVADTSYSSSSHAYLSKRYMGDGTCTNLSGSDLLYPTRTPVCGSNGGGCLVK